jgi:hypothetical protein
MRVLLLALLVASGCSKKKAEDNGPACPEVVDHMVKVMREGLKGHESVNLGDRDQMIDQCEKRNMTAQERRCMLTAKDLGALASCRPNKQPPPATKPPIPTPTPPPPTEPAPPAAGSGSAG